MPKYTPTDEEMDDSYSDKEAVAPPAETESETESEPTESVDEENAGAPEILVAKSKLPTGVKEGDTCTFKVTKDFGDELSLEPVKAVEKTDMNPDETAAAEISALDKGE